MIVYTQGSFDILHKGHINLLKKCRKLAGKKGIVYASVLTDKAYKKYRKYNPTKTFQERIMEILATELVDIVVHGDNTKTKQEIKTVEADIVVLGTDWAVKNIYKQYRMTKKELDPLLVFHPYTQGISSTLIKERMKHK